MITNCPVILASFCLFDEESKNRLRVRRFTFYAVGVRGFEPRTSRTRTVRSTGLSHTPKSSPNGEKRANYTILIRFGKLRIQQNLLAVDIEQPRHSVIVLADGQTGERRLSHPVRNGRLEQLRLDRRHGQDA